MRSHGIYFLIGFTLIVLTGIGYFTWQRLQELQQPAPLPPVAQEQTPRPEGPSAELSFSLAGSPTPGLATEQTTQTLPTCLSLTASPRDGTVPLTVLFTGQAVEKSATVLLFHFDFGDDTSQTVERLVTAPDGTETQTINHTYTEPGNYTASLIVENDNGTKSTACTAKLQIGGLAQSGEGATTPVTGTPTTSLLAQAPTKTPIPTKVASPTPTKISTPTPTKKPTPTSTFQEPFAPDVPKAGGFLPTVLAAVAGLAIIALPLLLL